jgi:hypothetical protein
MSPASRCSSRSVAPATPTTAGTARRAEAPPLAARGGGQHQRRGLLRHQLPGGLRTRAVRGRPLTHRLQQLCHPGHAARRVRVRRCAIRAGLPRQVLLPIRRAPWWRRTRRYEIVVPFLFVISNHFSSMCTKLCLSLVEKSLLVAHQFELCVAHMLYAIVATPLVKSYQWRISICATHSLPFSGTYPICAINILCVAHMAICTTDAICAISYKKYSPLTFRTGPKNRYFLVSIHSNT